MSTTPELSTTPESEPVKSSNRTGIIIALLSIIVIVQSVKIYLDYKDKVEIKEQKANVEEELASTMQRLTEIKTELDQKIAEIEKLGGDVTELQKAKAEVESQLKAENVAVKSVSSKGKEHESPFRNRQLTKLKVDFNIAENKVAPIEGKK